MVLCVLSSSTGSRSLYLHRVLSVELLCTHMTYLFKNNGTAFQKTITTYFLMLLKLHKTDCYWKNVAANAMTQ
jgi:hypothetical protein